MSINTLDAKVLNASRNGCYWNQAVDLQALEPTV